MVPSLLALKNLITGGKGEMINAATGLFDNLITNKEERELLKLKYIELENSRQDKLINATHEAEKIQLMDVQNSRAMQIAALNQEDKFSKHFVYYLASFIVLSAVAFGVMLFFVEVPDKNRRMVEMFTDIFLFAGAMMVLQFFFGSSVGSRRNTEVMQKQLTTSQHAEVQKLLEQKKETVKDASNKSQ